MKALILSFFAVILGYSLIFDEKKTTDQPFCFLYHTSITLYHKTSISFLREIKGTVCRTNGLIFSKLTTSVRKHPGVGRTDIRMFKEPTSGCTGVKMGMQRIFSALF